MADDSGSKISVSVWDKAAEYVADLDVGSGVSLVGVSAMRPDGDQIKLNMWESAYVCRGGAKAQSLTDLSLATSSLQTLTAAFVPNAFQPDVSAVTAAGSAVPTVCLDLAEREPGAEDVVFQVNRVTFAFVPDNETVGTPAGQARVVATRMHDVTGPADVLLTADTLPLLLGFDSGEDLKKALLEGTQLNLNRERFNARGVLRWEQRSSQGVLGSISQSSQVGDSGRQLKKYIVAVEPSPLDAKVSATAVRQMIGLSGVSSGLVLPIPAQRLSNHQLLGMTVAGWDQALPALPTLSLHRALLLVQGTAKTTLKPLGAESTPMEQQSYQVTSTGVNCLLSKKQGHDVKLTLTGYCGFHEMLAFRLDKDKALVTVSSWETGSAQKQPIAVIEHITKVPPTCETLLDSLQAEFSAVVGESSELEFTNLPPMKKLKSLASEPVTPKKSS